MVKSTLSGNFTSNKSSPKKKECLSKIPSWLLNNSSHHHHHHHQKQQQTTTTNNPWILCFHLHLRLVEFWSPGSGDVVVIPLPLPTSLNRWALPSCFFQTGAHKKDVVGVKIYNHGNQTMKRLSSLEWVGVEKTFALPPPVVRRKNNKKHTMDLCDELMDFFVEWNSFGFLLSEFNGWMFWNLSC